MIAKVAIWDKGREISYAELYKTVESIKCQIAQLPSPIVLALPKGYQFVCWLLACLQTDRTVIPVDISFPKRVDWIRNNTPWGSWVNVTEIISRESKWKGQGYIIYTSGSSGHPKGVYMAKNYINRVAAAQVALMKLEKPRTAWFLSPGFDASLSDIFVTFTSGGTLFIPTCTLAQPKSFYRFMQEHKITFTDLPPSTLNIFNPDKLPDLQTVIVGGEPTTPKAAEKWAGKVNLWNSYGPTEACIATSMVQITPDWKRPWIGTALPGITYLVVANELWIAGHLANKYLQDTKRTKDKFGTYQGTRYFKTGDIVEQDEFGLYFTGRKDRQLKRHGILICPEEIERKCSNYGDSHLAKINGDLILWHTSGSTEKLKNYLISVLDSKLLPSSIRKIDSLPRNSNHKVDVQMLIK